MRAFNVNQENGQRKKGFHHNVSHYAIRDIIAKQDLQMLWNFRAHLDATSPTRVQPVLVTAYSVQQVLGATLMRGQHFATSCVPQVIFAWLDQQRAGETKLMEMETVRAPLAAFEQRPVALMQPSAPSARQACGHRYLGAALFAWTFAKQDITAYPDRHLREEIRTTATETHLALRGNTTRKKAR